MNTLIPLISLVVPVKNGMPHLPATIQSIIDNSPHNAEIIVRNNASTDETAAYLKTLKDSRLRIYATETPETASENWTAACQLAKGKYTKIVCADDIILAGALDRQVRALESEPLAVMTASRRNIIDNAGSTVLRGHGLGPLRGRVSGARAIRTTALAGTNIFGEPVSVLFDTKSLQSSLPFEREWAYLTDLEMYRKVLLLGDLVALNSIDSSFRLATNSWSQSLATKQRSEFMRWVRGLRKNSEYGLGSTEMLRIILFVTVKTWLRRGLNSASRVRLRFTK